MDRKPLTHCFRVFRDRFPKQVDRLAQLLKRNGPRGPTPLAQRIRQLNWRLQREVKDQGPAKDGIQMAMYSAWIWSF